jgi:hypothetical protein
MKPGVQTVSKFAHTYVNIEGTYILIPIIIIIISSSSNISSSNSSSKY